MRVAPAFSAFLGEGITVTDAPHAEGSDAGHLSQTPTADPWAKNTPQRVILHFVQLFVEIVRQEGMIHNITIIGYW